MNEVITTEEKKTLKSLETVIARGVESFLATGSALKEIRDERLYRGEFKTFESYVKSRWGFERSRAYQLIDASEIKANLSTIVDKTSRAKEITTEGQIRELSSVPEDQVAEVVEVAAEIAGDNPITAKVLKEARQQVMSPEPPKDVWEDVEPEPANESDSEPKALAAQIHAAATLLDKLLREIKRLSDQAGGEWLDVTDIETKTKALKHSIRSGAYWMDCMDCGGKGCKTCRKCGWLSADRKQFLTQEQKDKVA